MRKKILLLPQALIVLISLIVIPLFGFGPFQVQHLPNQFTFQQHQGFDRIHARDFILQGKSGAPELPVKYLHYIIPPNMKVASIRVLSRTQVQLPGNRYIYPAQPTVPMCSVPPWVNPDSIIYNSDSIYPNKFIEVSNSGVFDGARIVTIAVYPLQYRPRSRRILLTNNISFELELAPAQMSDRVNVRGINGQKLYDAILKSAVENDGDIPIYYQQPTLIPEEPPEEQPPGGLYPSQYTIITADELVPYFSSFANWLTDKGVPASVVKLSNVLRYWNGVDDAEKLRNYIIDAYKYYGTIWVLLGGDAGIVPFRYGCADDYIQMPEDYKMFPSDLYFSDLNGDWDVDKDRCWGEPNHDAIDIFPEVFVGRILCRNPEEVNNWINKVLYYEQSGSDDLSLFRKTSWIYDKQAIPTPICPNPGTIQLFPSYFDHNYFDGAGADDAINTLNYGYGLYQIYCHGEPTTFLPKYNDEYKVHGYWEDLPYYRNAGLNHLANPNKYFIVYSIGCYNARYDYAMPPPPISYWVPSDTTIADAFTDTYESLGAVAFLGNAGFGWIRPPDGGPSIELHHTFCKLLFDYGASQLGALEAFSKVCTYNPNNPDSSYWRCVIHEHNLFGSPEMEPWINSPRILEVEHPISIPVGVPSEFLVRVTGENGNALCCTRVCLNKPGDIYEVSTTGRSGIVVFNICPETEGDIKVTCFRPRQSPPNQYDQYLPSQTICRIEGKGSSGGQAQTAPLLKELSLSVSSPITLLRNLNIFYTLPKHGRVRLILYDITGQVINVLKNEKLKPGYYTETFNIRKHPIPSGIYYLVLESEQEKIFKKFIIIK
jgi:hypothetical protein